MKPGTRQVIETECLTQVSHVVPGIFIHMYRGRVIFVP